MAVAAVVLASGGSAIATRAVTGAQVQNNTLESADIKDGTIQSRDIRDGTIRRADLNAAAAVRGPQGAVGPAGPLGPTGPTGSTGPPGTPAAPETWHALAFAVGWSNFGSAWATCAYRKDAWGRVHLRGIATKVASAPSGGDIIAVLPAGYRPRASHMFAVSTGGNQVYGRIDINSAGEMKWVTGSSVEPDYTSLDGITFWTD